jgi:hypothetical protein
VNRAWLVSVLLLVGGAASAGPSRPPPTPAAPSVHDEQPLAAPAPDGTGARPAPVASDSRRGVGILEVRVEGLSDDVKDSFQRTLEDQIDNKRYRLQNRAQMKTWMMRSTRWTDGCVIGGCLAELRKQSGAELVLLIALTGSGTSFGYVVTLVRTDTGRVVEQESDRCDVCTVSEVTKNATLAAINVLNNVPDKLPDDAAEQSAAVDRLVGSARAEVTAHERHTNRVAAAVTMVGLVAAVTGLALYVSQDQPSYAAMTAIGGATLAAGGAVVLAF